MKVSPPGGAILSESPARTFAPEDLSAEARLMAWSADRLLRRDVLPVRERLEAQDDGLMRRLVQQAGTLGLLAGNVPADYGGLGLPKTTLALLSETLARDLSFAVSAGIHAGVALLPLVQYGTPTQKARWLPRLARGELIGAFALSEANAGSDALAAQTRATLAPDGTHYVLHGTKQWITNAGFADLFTVFAIIDGRQFTAFLVEREFPGVSLGPEEKKLGLRGSSTRRLILDNVRVPHGNVLGEIGQGRRVALGALNPGRFAIAATALGAAKDALRIAARYAAQRRQFGKPIGEFGLIQHKLGEMTARIFALESMVYRTAGLWDERAGASDAAASEEYAMECAILKFWGTEAQAYVVDEAVQIHGGYGFSESFPVARAYRDARVFRLFEGTNEINRLTVLDQIFRRLAAGRLTLAPPTIPTDTVAQLRQTISSLLALFRTQHGDRWREQQEVAAALADMIAGLYALESAEMRAARLSGVRASTARLAADILADGVLAQTRTQAQTVLAALSPGDLLSRHRTQFNSLFAPTAVDAIGLRRSLASTVIANGCYPFP